MSESKPVWLETWTPGNWIQMGGEQIGAMYAEPERAKLAAAAPALARALLQARACERG